MNLVELKKTWTKQQLWAMSRDGIIEDAAEAVGCGKFFDKQDEILHNKTRWTVVKAGRNTAKSYNAAFIIYCLLWFGGLYDYEMHITVAGPTAEATRGIFEKMFDKDQIPIYSLGDEFDGMKIVKENWLTNIHKKKIRFANGSWIKAGSCDDPAMNDLSSDWHDLIIIDEFGNVPYKSLAISTAQGSLNRPKPLNLLWLVGTPDRKGSLGREFTRQYDLGQDDEVKHITSWHIRGRENPYRDRVSSEVGKEGCLIEDLEREEDGLDSPAGGRLFKDFTMDQVISRPFDPSKPYIAGVDVGFRKPVAEFMNVFVVEGDPIPYVHVFEEIAPKDIKIERLIEQLEKTVRVTCKGMQPVVMGVDKAGDNVKTNDVDTDFEAILKKFPQAEKNTGGWAVDKWNQVKLLQRLIEENHLTVDPSCEKLVDSLKHAGPNVDAKLQRVGPGWKKEKNLDDPLDALAYALINYGLTADLILEMGSEGISNENAIKFAEGIGWGV